MQRLAMASRITGDVYWAAAIGGASVALIVHSILNMLGAGIGAASVDANASGALPHDLLSSVEFGRVAALPGPR